MCVALVIAKHTRADNLPASDWRDRAVKAVLIAYQAICEAIYSEDGLDGVDGEQLLHDLKTIWPSLALDKPEDIECTTSLDKLSKESVLITNDLAAAREEKDQLAAALEKAKDLVIRHHASGSYPAPGQLCPVCSSDGTDKEYDAVFGDVSTSLLAHDAKVLNDAAELMEANARESQKCAGFFAAASQLRRMADEKRNGITHG